MWNRMVGANNTGPAKQAETAWNTAMQGFGPQVEVVNVDCGTGGDCVKMEETTQQLDGCADFTPGHIDSSTGLIDLASTMRFPQGTWQNASDARLQRSVEHELAHGFGMMHNYCTGADSITGAQSSCTSITGLAQTPTAQDVAQVASSPYGNGQERTCGFPVAKPPI
jgi:hypothetical protein